MEALRGLACLLLVAYHVIGNDVEHGMHVADSSGWRLFTEIFMHVRMPLFSFISGYVFSTAIANPSDFPSAWLRKLRRIGIPFVVVSTLFYVSLGYTAAGSGQIPLWQIYILPYEHYWYLQATLLIMTFLLAVALFAGPYRLQVLGALLPVSVVVFLLALTFDPDIFALGSALYLLPYFLLGHLIRLASLDRSIGDDPRRRAAAVLGLGILFAGLFVLDILSVEQRIAVDFSRQSAAGLTLGLTVCLLLFFLRVRGRWLEWIGVYSYSIYLFHVFATAGLRRIILAHYPDTPRGVFFVLALAAGIGLPILLHHLFIRHRASALLLLGIELKDTANRAEPRLKIKMASR